MNVQELRIGNKVLINGVANTITGIFHELGVATNDDIYFVQAEDKLDYLIDNVEPIILSDEILLKCGFIKGDKYPSWSHYLKISAATLKARIHSNRIYFEFEGIYLGDMIKTVHKLQNFYYTFHKSELKIDL